MILYKLPVYYRKSGSEVLSARFCACINVDGIGFYFYYKTKDELIYKNINRYMYGRTKIDFFIDAKTPEEAVNRFLSECEGAKIGGDERDDQKAAWIDREDVIVQLPDCDYLHLNRENKYICGEENAEDSDFWGTIGRCVLDGYDTTVDSCPLLKFNCEIYNPQKKDAIKININGKEYLFRELK